MKKDRVRDLFLEQLRKTPIVGVAAEKAGVSRRAIYNWRESDPAFAKEMEAALEEGEALLNDLTEGQLVNLIREGHLPAVTFWLRKRNPKFRDRVDITARVERNDAMTPEQEAAMRAALDLAARAQNQEPDATADTTPNKPSHEPGTEPGS